MSPPPALKTVYVSARMRKLGEAVSCDGCVQQLGRGRWATPGAGLEERQVVPEGPLQLPSPLNPDEAREVSLARG